MKWEVSALHSKIYGRMVVKYWLNWDFFFLQSQGKLTQSERDHVILCDSNGVFSHMNQRDGLELGRSISALFVSAENTQGCKGLPLHLCDCLSFN